MVSGWPIGFTKEKISFLNRNGQETVIDRKNIWSVEFLPSEDDVSFRQVKVSYKFIPPYTFRDCVDKGVPKNARKIYPQQVLADPVVIKRDLDDLQEGHEKIVEYKKEQDFYPVPIIYNTVTSIGLWQNFGSRHGASDKRPNNFLPFIKDSYMSDVFDYQHQFVTGSHPMPFSVHEESQVHAFYNFKDSYFHFSIMVDPNLILIGQNYTWQSKDFSEPTDRVNDSSYFEMGFDFGNFSFGLASNAVSLGAFDGVTFDKTALGVGGVVLYYQNHLFKVDASFKGGQTTQSASSIAPVTQTTVSVSRLNIHFQFFKDMDLSYSLINRELKYNNILNYTSTALVNAGYINYLINEKYTLGGMLSFESHNFNASGTSSTKLFPKVGIYGSLSF